MGRHVAVAVIVLCAGCGGALKPADLTFSQRFKGEVDFGTNGIVTGKALVTMDAAVTPASLDASLHLEDADGLTVEGKRTKTKDLKTTTGEVLALSGSCFRIKLDVPFTDAHADGCAGDPSIRVFVSGFGSKVDVRLPALEPIDPFFLPRASDGGSSPLPLDPPTDG